MPIAFVRPTSQLPATTHGRPGRTLARTRAGRRGSAVEEIYWRAGGTPPMSSRGPGRILDPRGPEEANGENKEGGGDGWRSFTVFVFPRSIRWDPGTRRTVQSERGGQGQLHCTAKGALHCAREPPHAPPAPEHERLRPATPAWPRHRWSLVVPAHGRHHGGGVPAAGCPVEGAPTSRSTTSSRPPPAMSLGSPPDAPRGVAPRTRLRAPPRPRPRSGGGRGEGEAPASRR